MSGSALRPKGEVPTLTEVVEWSDRNVPPAPPARDAEAPADFGGSAAPPAAPADAAAATFDELLAERVLADLQRQVDLVLEYRMREVLTPLLTRVADSMIREARSELSSTLHDVVARAIAQEVARHRTR